MNDPGLDEPIANASSEVHDTIKQNPRSKSQPDSQNAAAAKPDESHDTLAEQSPAYSKPRPATEDAAHELPTRWWYASTGFPLLAGTFGPMANAFSICALVQNWRVDVPEGGTEEHGIDVADPNWLLAVNGVSLAFAIIANLSLLLNMAKRVSFRWAQPITIVGFWLSSVLLTFLVGYAARDLRDPGQALTQAYYYGCWAAGLYQLISWMMCVTVYGALTHRYSSSFNLTMAQRTLMLQTITFLAYLLIGALIFSQIEGWKFLDAVYWSDFTLLTVGIGGDMVPVTNLGRGLLFPFSIGGIVALGLVISSIRTMVLDRGKRKVHARMTEKMRRKVVKQVDRICADSKQKRRKIPGMDKNLVKRLTLEPTNDPDEELERRRAEFEAMRRVEELTSRRHKWINLTTSTTVFATLWCIGAVVFWQTEGHNQGWSYFNALYFSWTSLLTIGYGDFVPLSNAGRPFFVFWSLLAVPSLTILISDMGDTVVKAVKDVTIWIGEVTILPSDQGSMRERLHYGIFKTLRIQLSKAKKIEDEEESTNEQSTFQQPGLVRLFKFPRKLFGNSEGNSEADDDTDRLARDFEASEMQDEQDAQQHGDHVAEDVHHYKHILIAEVRKLYADVHLATPKKYSYGEWAYYLKLLGEDESSSDFHRHAPVKPHTSQSHERDSSKAQTDGSEQSRGSSRRRNSLMRWSWIGPRSPLMTRGDRTESEWLVARLFERLEESLRDTHQEKDRVIGQHLRNPPTSADAGTPAAQSQASSKAKANQHSG